MFCLKVQIFFQVKMNLRPRQRRPPSDHSYSHIPGLPQYDLSSGPQVVSGPGLPAHKRPPVESPAAREPAPRKRRWYYGERKRKRRRMTGGRVKEELAEEGARWVEETGGDLDKPCTSESSLMGDPQPGPSHTTTTCTSEQDHTSSQSARTSGMTSQRHAACGACRQRNIAVAQHRIPHVTGDELPTPSRQSQRLVRKNYKLPFQGLPYTAKVHIFSMLPPCDRGHAAAVCKEWTELLQSPRLWANVDFSIFNPPIRRLRHSIHSRPFFMEWFSNFTEYNAYILRVAQYVSFLANVKPCLRSLDCAFDLQAGTVPSTVDTPGETWLQHLLKLLQSAQCHELQRVSIDWTKTPVRPPCAEKYCCLFNKARLKFQFHYKRIRQFHTFFNVLTQRALNITKLTLPFDWSPRSVLLLCRLRCLSQLTLQRYLGLGPLEQYLLDRVLRNLPELTHLNLDLCLGIKMNRYNLEHARLISLDLGTCHGFQLRRLKLPCLQTLVLPQRVANPGASPPCLYGLLREGCPQLTHLGKLRLQPFWLDFCYQELDEVLKNHCPCDTHAQQPPPQQNGD